jgi:lysozyme
MKKISKENKQLLYIIGGTLIFFIMSRKKSIYGGAGDIAANLIRQYEGLELTAKDDGFGTPTIGYGTINYPDGKDVQLDDTITIDQAEQYMWYELDIKINTIKNAAKVQLSDNSLAALASFAYNEGLTALFNSTLWYELNNGIALPVVAKQFEKWVYSNGNFVEGLKNRRIAEETLFLT